MTSPNAQLVLEAVRQFQTGSLRDAEPMWHEEAWISGPPDWPEAEPFRGRRAILSQFRRLGADWEELAFEDVEVVRDDGEWVVIHWTWALRGAASGVPVRTPMAGAYRIEDGKFAEAHFRRTVDEVLEVTANGD